MNFFGRHFRIEGCKYMFERIKSSAIRGITYPLYLGIKGRKESMGYFWQLKENGKKSIEENINIQKGNLYKQVLYAKENTAFYKKYIEENKLSFSIDNIYEDIKKLPIMTKKMIRENHQDLISSEAMPYIKNYSGGSTGEPLCILQDEKMEIYSPTNYFFSLAGRDIGEKVLSIWGSERDILGKKKSLAAQIAGKVVHRTEYLNSFRMKENEMEKYVKRINQWKPIIIYAYVQSIYEIAIFIKNNNLEVYSPKGIMVTAGTLFDEWRKEIEDAFKSPVFNQYGSREVSGIACECEKHEGLHVLMNSQYIEILDDEGNALEDGKSGNIVITNLINRKMPLIRYAIGDIGVKKGGLCSCGRGTELLERVSGRRVNIFKTVKGDKIDGEFFTHLFYGLDYVERFQVVQNKVDLIQIYIQLWKGNQPNAYVADMENIEKNIKKVMGDGCRIVVQIVDEIKPSASGKHIYTICNL